MATQQTSHHWHLEDYDPDVEADPPEDLGECDLSADDYEPVPYDDSDEGGG